jgi:DNA (cytosine-5)-methyltransferase 1
METIRYVDLFCGIGGFRIGFEQACNKFNLIPECVFSSDIDPYCQLVYEENFGEKPYGDITQIDAKNIPDHDILLGGFPCQPFSIIGQMKGFQDIRGTLFFDIARILKEKQPTAFILENVKQLVGHDKGRTLKTILKTLHKLGYHVNYSVLNALDYGLPHKRERIFLVGHKKPIFYRFPEPIRPFKPLVEILEKNVDKKYYASEKIRNKRKQKHESAFDISIWHENKSGNICSYPYSCALRAGASYNYLLVNGERRLTPREMLRLQGFPDTFKIVVSDMQVRRQTGNAVPVNLVREVSVKLLPFVAKTIPQEHLLKAFELTSNE